MAKNWLLAVLIALLVGVATYATGWGLLTWQAGNMLKAQTIEAPQQSGSLLDEALEGLQAITPGQAENQRKAELERMSEGLNSAYLILISITTVLAASWSVYAWSRVSQTGGAIASSAASKLWIGGMVAVGGVAAAALWLLLNRQGAAAVVTDLAKGGVIVAGIVLAWLSFYLSTAFGAPAQLRASVPFATVLVPLGRSR